MPLYFLMRLRNAELPLTVSQPDEIKLVSVLKATGLIEASFDPPLSSVGTYAQAQRACVLCLTEEGLAELDDWISGPRQRRA